MQDLDLCNIGSEFNRVMTHGWEPAMKEIVLLFLGAMSFPVASAASGSPPSSAALLVACAAGSAISALYSVRRSRAAKEATLDAGINVCLLYTSPSPRDRG